MGGVVLQGLLFILGFGSILFLTYIVTKYIAGKSSQAMKGRYINVVETVNIGMDKRLHLVNVGGQYFVIASSGKSIEFLTAVMLDGREDIEASQEENAFSFKSLFDKYVQSYKSRKNDKEGTEISENFKSGLKGVAFKSNLNKLKDINKRMGARVKEDGDEDTNEE